MGTRHRFARERRAGVTTGGRKKKVLMTSRFGHRLAPQSQRIPTLPASHSKPGNTLSLSHHSK